MTNEGYPANQLHGELWKSNLRFAEHIQKKQVDLDYEVHRQEFLTDTLEKRAEKKFIRKIYESQVVANVYRAANGDIMLAHMDGGRKIVSTKLLQDGCLNFYIFYTKHEELLRVSYRWNEEEKILYIEPNHDAFFKALSNAGIHFLRFKQKDLKMAFFSFVLREAERQEIPERWGWNVLIDRRFHFCSSETNMEELRNGCK